ncbi:MAG TPA: aminomethyl-transferring glycine dehydrogenase [bacterium]|nr:aminomethyl-transferring glycine dehydrogenase [bacterium]
MSKQTTPELFSKRHIGPDANETEEMLRAVGAGSLEELMDQTIPPAIRSKKPLSLDPAMSEFDYLNYIRTLAGRNKVYRSFIGMGFYDCITPSVILRNVFENPGWYTQYTPYQAEISQGRLEALMIFQTMISEMTGFPVANASLLDEGTAAGEAMTMIKRLNSKKAKANVFLVDAGCLPQTIAVLHSRAVPLGIDLKVTDLQTAQMDESVFGLLLQYPDALGQISNPRPVIEKAHQAGVLTAMACDLLSLALLTPPGELGADIAIGSSQRFGVPMGYGGPHAGFMATRDDYKRSMPGRLIGLSIDRHGRQAYRMALQTREQHIRREKATSNICTAQALLAIMAGMYAVWHGAAGIKAIAERVHSLTTDLATGLTSLGYRQWNSAFFDTLQIETADKEEKEKIRQAALAVRMNFNYLDDRRIGISLDETTSAQEVKTILQVFAGVRQKTAQAGKSNGAVMPTELQRQSAFLAHPVFQKYHSEHKMVRFLKSLENKDLSLTTSMIPLGSCTMKLNACTEMLALSWPEFARMHPFAPVEQAQGYAQIFTELESALCRITGFSACSLQPNSGAQGELTGLLVIRAWHHDRGQTQRNVTLIPSSAHGTNPASAVMAGMNVVVVACDEQGNIDVADLQAKAEKHHDTLAALMVTYPSTHGVFEERIMEICRIIHDHGGQVYMDGANMNAQVGFTSPAAIGADVCHLNLHKTFAIPHGGGGPGMGPICVAEHLQPFLPGHPIVPLGGAKAIPAVCSTPWGSASILIISHAYIKMMGADGLRAATQYAILNANYIKTRLQEHYPVLYTGQKGRVAHEMIFDLKAFKPYKIEAEDVAKRLMDYGFHAPTVSFPVHDSIMVEPTESEDKAELDRFCEAMILIRKEIQSVIDGAADGQDNPLKMAPHTALEVCANQWPHAYSREQAAYAADYLRQHKFWPSVGRIDNTYGDRNVVCTCPPMDAYEQEKE